MIKRLFQIFKKQVGSTPRTDLKNAPPDNSSPETPLIPEKDYYIDTNGLYVFTADYLKRRGYCCDNGCRHCPY
ncbi:DUF5522 domain-containing protein [Pseudobdellovibrio exovorus]|uniref:DUF5522 domain-containing protein n=1 Tax=Pseudobdellovibrio exovorus TaxID=453816 RepID=UPI0003460B58